MEKSNTTAPCDQGDAVTRPAKRQRGHADHHACTLDLFGRLPDELLLAVLVTLDDTRLLASWAQTSRRHRRLANDPLVWRRLCESHFGPPLHRRFLEMGKCWRWLYRAQARIASATGDDTGAIILEVDEDNYHVYWGDCLNGLPHGYGLRLQLPSRHCNPDLSPARVKACVTDSPNAPIDAGHEGEWRNGQRHGYGVGMAADGGREECNFVDNKVNGYGVCVWADGTTYEGMWRDNNAEGFGVQKWPDGNSHRGLFFDGQPHGYGTFLWADGQVYRGMWRCNQRDGYGTCVYTNGTAHQGEWRDDMPNGFGVSTKANGTAYKGDWLNGLRHGYGIYTKSDGCRYSGWWMHNFREGRGMWEYADGSCVQGRWWHWGLNHGIVTRHRAGEPPCIEDFLCTACIIVAVGGGRRSMDVCRESSDA
ncbi:Morn repeat domain containing protein [Pandoravirus salinus]|uniref:Morn repeat domain containing protein n=1 Tax=Pandoravirus salinus TaxID=1349410 RepID=S4W3L2_9VIRU|nr:morn repeat domain [Pandoravirus salinus]AGO84875.1 Morn repeat domain containing protein [Pandoravirus salinus]